MLWQQARKVGKGKGKGCSGGRAAPKKDRKANNKEKGKEAEPCTVDWLRGWSGAYLRWVAQKARQEKAISELFAKLAEEDRAWQNGNIKEKGKHIEELKSKVKEGRETVLNRRWAHGVVNKIKRLRSCGRYVLEGNGNGSTQLGPLCINPSHRRKCGEVTIGEGPSGESQQELEWSIYHWRSAIGCARRLGLRAILRNGTDARQGERSSTDTDTSKSSDSD